MISIGIISYKNEPIQVIHTMEVNSFQRSLSFQRGLDNILQERKKESLNTQK